MKTLFQALGQLIPLVEDNTEPIEDGNKIKPQLLLVFFLAGGESLTANVLFRAFLTNKSGI